ncbi:class I adenylate-forming enzyme family protein [Pseudonocardia endophytica]|uniref:Acyl-CoA synthetase (AMP-forming)/AMP-acid ligase II n=1 Tax=Pseudonocardia endophytica TaxID=401976 RepID=A0A4V2PHE8_PSEEN|nr:class I adenylate-forming enzyme family protein [Pseudonocardia endophytica]TCK20446.1 acyl-CoA synthetase (AMP-forming)/AMP-acid ligase II [Pseudonocardia endophytica]
MRPHPPERIDEFVAAGWWSHDPARSWDEMLRARVADRPDATALVDPANRRDLLGSPLERLTWAGLDTRVSLTAAALAEHGIAVDTVVGTQLPNTVELLVTTLAIARLGAIVCPFPTAYREHELSTLAPVAGLAAMVTVGSLGGRDLAGPAASTGVPVLEWGPDGLRAAGGTAPGGVGGSDSAGRPHVGDRTRGVDTVPRLRRHPSEVVTLCWTSGTESTPKAVPRCANSWHVIGTGCAAAPALTADDVILSPFPLVNMAGFGGVLVPWLLTGATLVCHHPFDLPTFLGQIATERVSYTLAPPALLVGMLDAPGLLERADLSSLRVIGSGSAPLPPRLIAQWRERTGIEVTNFFGSNEGIGLISDQHTVPDPEQRAAYFPWFGGPAPDGGTLSWPNPIAGAFDTRLVDPATGEEITEPDRPGELRVGGPTVFAGYWTSSGLDPSAWSPEAASPSSAAPATRGPGSAIAGPFDEHGRLRTGDLFAIAAHDPTLLRYVDRARDVVVRGGANIAPAELEALIGALPGIAEVAVVGTPDDQLGERVTAVVVPAADADPPPTLDSVVTALREKKIASYKLPERLETVEALPRNALGKVLKRELRAALV